MELRRRAAAAAEVAGLPVDGLWGHAAIELKLTDLLRLVAQLPPLSSPVVPATSRKTTRRKVAARSAAGGRARPRMP